MEKYIVYQTTKFMLDVKDLYLNIQIKIQSEQYGNILINNNCIQNGKVKLRHCFVRQHKLPFESFLIAGNS